MKYIVVDGGLSDVPYIFPDHIEHTHMAGIVHGQVLSAGFISIAENKIQCYGNSVGLDIKSRPEDSDLINRLIGAADDDY